MIYLQLLWSFIQIGLFSIGGGYAAMPIIQHLQAVKLLQAAGGQIYLICVLFLLLMKISKKTGMVSECHSMVQII